MPFAPQGNPVSFAPAQWSANPMQRQVLPAPATKAQNVQTQLPPSKIRMQAPDAPKPAPTRLVLPSPEQLGIQSAVLPASVPAQLDWNQAHARLQQLGALGFHLDRLPQGGFRATFYLPSPQRQSTQLVEAVAQTEAAAVAAALERAELFTARK
ncbi:MAG: hypothetical protein L0215_09000 [Gemmataceae bacterium]|nr:hypothetical protein [Gemmataceae bacterium]